jgi:nicotinamide mononucleotide transporter
MLELLTFEQISVAFALAYLALAIRQSIWCWPAALISVTLWAMVAFGAGLYADAALQVFYFAMGVYGWFQWSRGGTQHAGVDVHRWPVPWHALAIVVVLIIGAGFGWVLSGTAAQFPYLDSFTTIAAIVATFMVARKVMENWIYWFVIDSLYIYLYLQRDLAWYAGLYLVYLVMIVIGYRAWLKSMQAAATVRDDRVAV